MLVGGHLDGAALIGWTLALLTIGAGVGLAFPHLIVAAMSSARDPDEAAQASAGISTAQLLSNALFSALCGLLLVLPIDGFSGAQVLAVGVLVIVALVVVSARVASLRIVPRRTD